MDCEEKILKKIISSNEIEKICKEIKNQGVKVAFTNGCFDLIHFGHIQTFLEAKSLADILIVGINSNQSIKKIKGDKRPIIDENYRCKLIASLECVDYVLLFDDESPSNLIDHIKPDFYIKGSDWKERKLPEEDVVLKNNGPIYYVDLVNGLSTSVIIKKLWDVYG